MKTMMMDDVLNLIAAETILSTTRRWMMKRCPCPFSSKSPDPINVGTEDKAASF